MVVDVLTTWLANLASAQFLMQLLGPKEVRPPFRWKKDAILHYFTALIKWHTFYSIIACCKWYDGIQSYSSYERYKGR